MAKISTAQSTVDLRGQDTNVVSLPSNMNLDWFFNAQSRNYGRCTRMPGHVNVSVNGLPVGTTNIASKLKTVLRATRAGPLDFSLGSDTTLARSCNHSQPHAYNVNLSLYPPGWCVVYSNHRRRWQRWPLQQAIRPLRPVVEQLHQLLGSRLAAHLAPDRQLHDRQLHTAPVQLFRHGYRRLCQPLHILLLGLRWMEGSRHVGRPASAVTLRSRSSTCPPFSPVMAPGWMLFLETNNRQRNQRPGTKYKYQ